MTFEGIVLHKVSKFVKNLLDYLLRIGEEIIDILIKVYKLYRVRFRSGDLLFWIKKWIGFTEHLAILVFKASDDTEHV